MPRGGKRKHSGRKPRDISESMQLWVIDRVRFHLAEGEKHRNERWQKKNIKSRIYHGIEEAREHYASIERLNSERKQLHSDLKKACTLKGVMQLTEFDSPTVRKLRNVENSRVTAYEDLQDIFSNTVPGGGLLTPIPAPSNRDMSLAFHGVVSDASNCLTLREVKDAWAAWRAFERQFKQVD